MGTSIKTDQPTKPFVKWAGGKANLLPQLSTFYPKEFNHYFEPFIGGGAVFFSLDIRGNACINDVNTKLINVYRNIQQHPEKIISELQLLEAQYNALEPEQKKAYFYEKRDEFNHTSEDIQQSVDFIFLNKTCFNGLYRENRKGLFNVPYGRHHQISLVNAKNIKAISAKLQQTIILNTDFRQAVAQAERDDFIYFDPPYFPLNATSSFTSYSKDDFDADDQINLALLYKELHARGCKVMLSNSNTGFICDLYKDFTQVKVSASRAIGANGATRKKIDEILILNY